MCVRAHRAVCVCVGAVAHVWGYAHVRAQDWCTCARVRAGLSCARVVRARGRGRAMCAPRVHPSSDQGAVGGQEQSTPTPGRLDSPSPAQPGRIRPRAVLPDYSQR